MALTNKNGLTPGQVTLQKEILDRFDSLEAQNAELKAQNDALTNHIAELKKALEKFQKEVQPAKPTILKNYRQGLAGLMMCPSLSIGTSERNLRSTRTS